MRVSVALCTYNGEKYLKEQIDSILNQTLKVDEILICDDGSNDNTISILENYSKNNPGIFKIHINEINLRSVKNFEKAISLCSGDIIFLSDQDDIWVSNKVKSYVDYFDTHTNIKVLASNGFCIDENSKVHDKYSLWDVPNFLKEINIEVDYFRLITYVANIATGASMAIKKEIIPDIVPFPIMKGFHHDEWIAIIASKNKQFEMLNEEYFYYRIHSNQQVGGVFFDKTLKNKEMLINYFNINPDSSKFKIIKKNIKKYINAYEKNFILFKINSKYKEYFKNNILEIEQLIQLNFKILKDKHFTKYCLLKISDKILNKRQFNKIKL